VNEEKPPRPGLSLLQRALLGSFLIFVLTAAATATAALLEVDKLVTTFRDANTGDVQVEASLLDDVDGGGPQTIMVLGSDRRFADIKSKAPARSDTIILVRLNPDRGATAVMSLPRDLKVQIPGHGTDKINAAYAIGGPSLTFRTVKRLMAEASIDGSFPIHHVVNVNFGGFQRAVNRLGCVYADIDRDYFNDNRPPFGGGPNYAAIDINAGYQKICGRDSLDFVRYRHFDSDLVRGARQQEFLRQAKEQIGVSKLFNDREQLVRIFGRYTDTDIRSTKAILRLLKLALESAQKPVQEVQFPGEVTGTYVEVSHEKLADIVDRFMNAKASPGSRGSEKETGPAPKRRARKAGVAPGLQLAKIPGEDVAALLSRKLAFPVYYPKLMRVGGSYLKNDSRTYDIYDRGKPRKRYRAYRIVVRTREIGQYYGVQGMTWKSPPILDNPSETRTIRKRKYELFFDGNRLRLVAWRTERAVYWVSNTLLHSLTNKQMLGIAGSLSRVGQK
jgi:LCP family protein required for cell wall assembly